MSSRPVWAKIKLFQKKKKKVAERKKDHHVIVGHLSTCHVAQVFMWIRKPILRDYVQGRSEQRLCASSGLCGGLFLP